MSDRLTIKGRLIGPTTVELERPVTGVTTDVEVVLSPQSPSESWAEFFKKFPPGNRTKEDIDRQIREERDSWGDR